MWQGFRFLLLINSSIRFTCIWISVQFLGLCVCLGSCVRVELSCLEVMNGSVFTNLPALSSISSVMWNSEPPLVSKPIALDTYWHSIHWPFIKWSIRAREHCNFTVWAWPYEIMAIELFVCASFWFDNTKAECLWHLCIALTNLQNHHSQTSVG